MITMSGVLRGSYVARFLKSSHDPMAFLTKSFLFTTGKKEQLIGIKSLATSPWDNHPRDRVHNFFPNLKWAGFISIPEQDDAITHLSQTTGFLANTIFTTMDNISPGDSMVESAASMLPPDTKIQEIVVPVFGPHALSVSRFENGERIAPISQENHDHEIITEAGPEMLDAFFRAIPTDLLY